MKPRVCGNKRIGGWTGDTYTCTLNPGHRGPHSDGETQWGEMEAAYEEWVASNKASYVRDTAERETRRQAFEAGWHARGMKR